MSLMTVSTAIMTVYRVAHLYPQVGDSITHR
jgi:hypothetical protein